MLHTSQEHQQWSNTVSSMKLSELRRFRLDFLGNLNDDHLVVTNNDVVGGSVQVCPGKVSRLSESVRNSVPCYWRDKAIEQFITTKSHAVRTQDWIIDSVRDLRVCTVIILVYSVLCLSSDNNYMRYTEYCT
jgi:hypothetical protein